MYMVLFYVTHRGNVLHTLALACIIKTMYCFVHCVFPTYYIYYFIINSTYSILLVKHGLNYIFHLVLMGQLVTLFTIVCIYDIYTPFILFLTSRFSIWLLIFGCSFCLSSIWHKFFTTFKHLCCYDCKTYKYLT